MVEKTIPDSKFLQFLFIILFLKEEKPPFSFDAPGPPGATGL